MKPVIIVSDHDGATNRALMRAISHSQVMRNIEIIGATHAAGLPVEFATMLGATPLRSMQPEPRQKTALDIQRIAAAEAKRQRRAAAKPQPDQPAQEDKHV